MSFNEIKSITIYVCLLFNMGLKHFGHLASPYYCFWNWCFRTHICSLAWLLVVMKVYEILLLLGRGTKLVSTYLEWNAQCTYLRMAAQHSTAVQWSNYFKESHAESLTIYTVSLLNGSSLVGGFKKIPKYSFSENLFN